MTRSKLGGFLSLWRLVSCLDWSGKKLLIPFCFQYLEITVCHVNWIVNWKKLLETANIWTAYSCFFQKIKQPGLHEGARIACSMSMLLADLWHTVWNVIFNDVKCWTRKEHFCPLGASLHKLVLGLAIVVNAERFRMHIQIYTYMHKLTSSNSCHMWQEMLFRTPDPFQFSGRSGNKTT